MAVYTAVPIEALRRFMAEFDMDAPYLCKGIAQGVENSNFIVFTTENRYVLTLYEKRVSEDDLPFFLDLIDHLARHGHPVPRAIPDRHGKRIHTVEGRPACLIDFLPGRSVEAPTPTQARAAGEALGRLHGSLADFEATRPNPLGLDTWRPLLERCGPRIDEIASGLRDIVSNAIARTEAAWPRDLPRATIHADLFPDNVLVLGDKVSGVLDFYFACTDLRALDLAVMHSAWAFDITGARFDTEVSQALIEGYEATFGLSTDERAALSVVARGACIRFLLTRAWDWLNTPPDALVTPKDPLAYLRRLEFYERRDVFA